MKRLWVDVGNNGNIVEYKGKIKNENEITKNKAEKRR